MSTSSSLHILKVLAAAGHQIITGTQSNAKKLFETSIGAARRSPVSLQLLMFTGDYWTQLRTVAGFALETLEAPEPSGGACHRKLHAVCSLKDHSDSIFF